MPWGKTTLYRDILFRSRLEARWAAFFDLLDWPWIYEPMKPKKPASNTGPSIGWNPDFLLNQMDVLVEVKPMHPGDHQSSPFSSGVEQKINMTIPGRYSALIVGCTIPFSSERSPGPVRFDYKNKRRFREEFLDEVVLPGAADIAGFPVGYMLGMPSPEHGLRPPWDLGVIQWADAGRWTVSYDSNALYSGRDATDKQDELLAMWTEAERRVRGTEHRYDRPPGAGERGPR